MLTRKTGPHFLGADCMHALTLDKRAIGRDFCLVILASFGICLAGQISIPLWFTPVPLATQNAAVLLLAVLLGARRGAAATFAFLAQGAMGLPVFSTGASGLAVLLGPTGGYLVGYLIAAFIAGRIAEREKTLLNALKALGVGNLIIYLCGASYLSVFVGLSQAFVLGVFPFLLGDLFKMCAGLKILQMAGWKKK